MTIWLSASRYDILLTPAAGGSAQTLGYNVAATSADTF